MFATILAGVTVFVFGQILLKLMIDPIQKLREAIAEVVFRLANDHDVIHNNANIVDKEVSKSVASNFSQLSARLFSCQQLIPFYSCLRKPFSLPDEVNIGKAAQRLAQIPKHMYGDDTNKYYRLDLYSIEVCELLQLQDPIHDGMSKQELLDAIKENRGQAHNQ